MRGISGILQVEAACLVLIEEDSGELVVRGGLGQDGDDIRGRVLDPAGAVVGEVVVPPSLYRPRTSGWGMSFARWRKARRWSSASRLAVEIAQSMVAAA